MSFYIFTLSKNIVQRVSICDALTDGGVVSK